MADHCYDLPVALWCEMRRTGVPFQRSGWEQSSITLRQEMRGVHGKHGQGVQSNGNKELGFRPKKKQRQLLSFIKGPSVYPACNCSFAKALCVKE